ncbi:MAG: bifunctional phosphoribosyl-AMP cyclohydrolase/phosphoribosyl-ATP diphosphatase HisIE [Bacteroidales bacterium]|nr:bifunctional phosphoribosyl-AMP cyclohydrolase/phosphoribosyl-ATP diphosphatase HisIE [Bacteroidales bacterium]MBO7566256.1 bifunctional phosphoribosyl-AMP cyclohydrolase/phosphoribosyl-ATP diphosphatase HisIE [Bacteroidales bacterium]
MTLDFEKMGGMIPAIVQDNETLQVLMLGYMNEEAFNKTKETKKVTFWSRSRNCLWTKGETSGNFLHLKEMYVDCDNDTILIKAKPDGPTCHKGTTSCFDFEESNIGFLSYLQKFIDKRNEERPAGSYTTKLFREGVNKIAKKVGEEAVELVIESKDNNDSLFLNEAADLLYHLIVLLSSRGKKIEDVVAVLKGRHQE